MELNKRKTKPLTSKELRESLPSAVGKGVLGVRLQPRDYEILRFILEQKFVSLESIYFRFFDVRAGDEVLLPKNLWTTRQRLAKLRSVLLIKTEKVLSSGKAHFLITPLGYKVLREKDDEVFHIKPTKRIDFSLYEHDLKLTMLRAFLEKKGKSNLWRSEKWLRGSVFEGEGYRHRFSKELIPDAVFYNARDERVALEVELSRKGQRRLIEKVERYNYLLKEGWCSQKREDRPAVLDKVWIVVTKPLVKTAYLKAIAEASGDQRLNYRVDYYKDVVPKCAQGES